MINMEIRDNTLIIRGYINAVERDSRRLPSPHGQFVEQVKAGVWTRALKNGQDVTLLLNHNWDRKLGGISQGNLILTEDNIGLHAEARVLDAEVVNKARNNQLAGWSFGFKTNKDTWSKTEDGIDRRYLEDIELFEVSILDDTRVPAYIGTSIESRNNEEVAMEQRFIKEVTQTIYDKKDEETRESKEDLELRKNKLLIELEL